MDFSEDQELLDRFHKRAGHSLMTIRSYKTVFSRYREFHNMSLSELLDEALREQEQQLPVN